MTDRQPALSREEELQATIDRLREELEVARRSARTWRRIAEWIHNAHQEN